MNEPSNAPMLPPPSGISEWMSVWRDALTRPSDQTFARIGLAPNARASTGLLWVFLGSLVSFFLGSLFQGPMMSQVLQNSGLDPNALPAVSGGLLAAICGAPIGAVFSTVMFALAIGVVQLIARMFGGRGTFDQLTYAIAAIVAPFSIISGLLTLFSAIPIVGAAFCFGLLGFAVWLYILVLEVMAVKGVNQFGWGQAAASLLLPVFAIACCVAVVIGGLLSVLAPEMMDTFNSFMTPVP